MMLPQEPFQPFTISQHLSLRFAAGSLVSSVRKRGPNNARSHGRIDVGFKESMETKLPSMGCSQQFDGVAPTGKPNVHSADRRKLLESIKNQDVARFPKWVGSTELLNCPGAFSKLEPHDLPLSISA
jgi:hypothetical protein